MPFAGLFIGHPYPANIIECNQSGLAVKYATAEIIYPLQLVIVIDGALAKEAISLISSKALASPDPIVLIELRPPGKCGSTASDDYYKLA